jgi:hypothetical protein
MMVCCGLPCLLLLFKIIQTLELLQAFIMFADALPVH